MKIKSILSTKEKTTQKKTPLEDIKITNNAHQTTTQTTITSSTPLKPKVPVRPAPTPHSPSPHPSSDRVIFQTGLVDKENEAVNNDHQNRTTMMKGDDDIMKRLIINDSEKRKKKISHSKRSIKRTKRVSLLTQDVHVKSNHLRTKKRIRRKAKESFSSADPLTLHALSSLSSNSGPTNLPSPSPSLNSSSSLDPSLSSHSSDLSSYFPSSSYLL